MEEKVPEYLSLIESGFDDKDVDIRLLNTSAILSVGKHSLRNTERSKCYMRSSPLIFFYGRSSRLMER